MGDGPAGVLDYLLREDEYPIAPMVLGMILGPIAEQNLRRSLECPTARG